MENKIITGNEPSRPAPINQIKILNGLTIRQEFAARFMAASISNPEAMEFLTKNYSNDLTTAFDRIAAKSLKLADALIAELNKPCS